MPARITSGDPDPIYVLRTGPQSVCNLRFTTFKNKQQEKSQVLISGSENGLVQIWNLKCRRVEVKFIACDGEAILYVDIINIDDSQVVICHARNGHVQFWCVNELLKPQLNTTFTVLAFGYCPIAIYTEGNKNWIAYPSGEDSQVSMGNIDLNGPVNPVVLKPDNKCGIVMHIRLFRRAGKILALAGYEDGSVILWDLSASKGTLVDTKKICSDSIMCLDVDAASSKLICGSPDHSIHVYRIDDDLKLQTHLSHDSASSGFACAVIRNDGRIVACGGWDGKVRVFGWKKLKILAILKYHTQIVNNVCFSNDNLLAAASKDGRISVWDVYKDT